MKMKKLLSGAMAAAMALSISATALAADTIPEGFAEQSATGNVKITGSTQLPTIKVMLPTSGSVILNPYKLTVGSGDDATTDQVISDTQYITNRSNMAVRVTASVTGAVAGNAKFSPTSTTAEPAEGATALTSNSAYVVFEMIGADDSTTAVDSWDGAATAVLKVGAVTAACAEGADDTAKNKATLMNAATIGEDGTTPATTNGYIAFHLTGDAVSAPKTAWVAADKISATIAFSFSPEVVAAADEGGGD